MENKDFDFYEPIYDRIGYEDPFKDYFKRLKMMNKQLGTIITMLGIIIAILILFLIRSMNGAL